MQSQDIPIFYHKIPDDSFKSKLKHEARASCLQAKHESLLSSPEMQELWKLLEIQSAKFGDQTNLTMDYADFKRVAELSNIPKARCYFTAKVFARLVPSKQRRISVVSFFNYVMKHVWTQQTRIGLTMYDDVGDGCLREADLQNYVEDLIPSLSELESMEEAFHPFYVCIVVRKFFFFLDPHRTGRVKIVDILGSTFLHDLVEELRDHHSKKTDELNWFSLENSQRLYRQYTMLDEDGNGMLNQIELSKFNGGSLTKCLIGRIFEEFPTYDKEVDFKTYIDFVIAMENKKEPQALLYFFKLLDIHNKGYLDTFVLYYFFKDMQCLVKDNGQEALNFEDVCNEIYDIVKPAAAGKITLYDLINCGQGDVVVSILSDYGGFWAYENRDMSPAASPEEVDL
ncbi:Serine/threonine-protein phosphatase 2A regulatory subunit B'' subunit gamma [Halotydeus destructor]|nr:Serine/threonine-protein phosphatase 2A regulatory subunit B'' subunit gamma [Halotydeus destructor]